MSMLGSFMEMMLYGREDKLQIRGIRFSRIALRPLLPPLVGMDWHRKAWAHCLAA